MRTLIIGSLSCLLFAAAGCEATASRVEREAKMAALEAEKVALDAAAMELKRAAETLVSTGAKVERNSDNEVVAADLRGIEVTDTLATEIAKLKELSKLTINESSMSVAGWQTIGTIPGLQQLDIRDCPINNEQFSAAVTNLRKLRAVRLNGKSGRTQVDDRGLAALSNCSELKVLAIDSLWITVAGIKQLAANQKLAEIYAGDTALDDESVELLAQLPDLRKIRLSRTGVGAPGLEALSKLPLEELDVSECSGVSDDSLVVIAKMHSLKRLNLWRDTVGDIGVEHLSQLTNLEWLNLDNTHLADAGLSQLSDMSKLTFLHIGSTGITDAGMPALVGLKSLKDLKVTRTAVTEAGVAVVKEAIPDVNVQLEYIEGE